VKPVQHSSVAANVAAGLGFLAAGLASGSVEAALVRYRRQVARWQIERWVCAAERTSPRWRWLHGTWARSKWRDDEFRERHLVRVWLPPALFLPVLMVVFLASAAGAFTG
jgi:hypothetical protein